MKTESKIFDRIRVKPDQDRLLRERHPRCEWPGCAGAGMHKAPMGRKRIGEYHTFCIDHVRIYNKSYNYFEGMSDDAVIQYQKSALTGHRPTWQTSADKTTGDATPDRGPQSAGATDPFGFFESAKPVRPARTVRNAERRALSALSLDETATPEQVKCQYKLLVKRHHPDANGGTRDSEEKLRDIIQAYDYLKTSGFC